ncbi:8-hydroxygeraniol dehydrogenase-like [Asparagus officinalis]|uniref:8-hydroxygeraniol dehydrogenase-like n=1 Tax=Asparagus officinalis TaxID=4686 RepID=UPI00098E32AD|nr:8-hydroxygeraniol dehydrogenase-like [Asparagus officinalis]
MAEFSQAAVGWAARDDSGVLSPFNFSLREARGDDIILRVLYCGICHSDLSTIKNEWGSARYPLIPGHEIVGTVIKAGPGVRKFRINDKVGVGYMADSCLDCDSCNQDAENYCAKLVRSFNSKYTDGSTIYGGFSNFVIVKEHFGVRIPEGLPLERAAPLMCAGTTVYSPMRYFGFNEAGKHLGVVGLGGLGHLAVKFAKAFGMRVTVISTSPSKEKEATEVLGADSFLLSSVPEQLKAFTSTMDGILDTTSAIHQLPPLFSLLKVRGKLILLGGASKPLELPAFSIIQGGKILAGSCIGGIKETQEMIDFAAMHNITADVEVIGIDYVNKAMERLDKGDIRYRFVIDVANTI